MTMHANPVNALAAFINRPSLISEQHLARVMAVAGDRIGMLGKVASSDDKSDLEQYLEGFIPPVAKYRVDKGIATIPVHGAIGRGMSEIERLLFGFTDIDTIASNLARAEADDDVDLIAFDFNTPGGGVSQVPETADAIANASKPTVAVVDELCASAGMWLAASCDHIAATKSAELGSIGVYASIFDVSAYYEQLGVAVEVFKSGKYKAAGLPGTSLSDEQRDMVQESVDETFEQFKGWIGAMRGDVPDDAMQGQCFSALKAMEYGLCDEIMPSKSQAFSGLRKLF